MASNRNLRTSKICNSILAVTTLHLVKDLLGFSGLKSACKRKKAHWYQRDLQLRVSTKTLDECRRKDGGSLSDDIMKLVEPKHEVAALKLDYSIERILLTIFALLCYDVTKLSESKETILQTEEFDEVMADFLVCCQRMSRDKFLTSTYKIKMSWTRNGSYTPVSHSSLRKTRHHPSGLLVPIRTHYRYCGRL